MRLIFASVVLAAIGLAQSAPPCPPLCPPPEFMGKATKKKQTKTQKPAAEGQKKTVK